MRPAHTRISRYTFAVNGIASDLVVYAATLNGALNKLAALVQYRYAVPTLYVSDMVLKNVQFCFEIS